MNLQGVLSWQLVNHAQQIRTSLHTAFYFSWVISLPFNHCLAMDLSFHYGILLWEEWQKNKCQNAHKIFTTYFKIAIFLYMILCAQPSDLIASLVNVGWTKLSAHHYLQLFWSSSCDSREKTGTDKGEGSSKCKRNCTSTWKMEICKRHCQEGCHWTANSVVTHIFSYKV
jgi:hypothetical protein